MFPGFWVFVLNDLDLGTAFDGSASVYSLSMWVPISDAGHDSCEVL